MAKILVISAHQNLQQSISNRLILADLEQHFVAVALRELGVLD